MSNSREFMVSWTIHARSGSRTHPAHPKLYGKQSRMFPEQWITDARELVAAGDSALRVDETGTIRIGNSRITLDLIVDCYHRGATPEEIVASYDTLLLADVHLAIGHYLRYQAEAERYLQRREDYANQLREKIESERPRITREELLRPRQEREQLNASAGQ